MALWNSGVKWSSGSLWGPAAPPPEPVQHANKRKKRNTMKRDKFYPRRESGRPEWHINFAAKFQVHGPVLGFTAAQINQAVADNLVLAYALGDWKTNLYEAGPAGTAAIALLESGTGGGNFAFPTWTAPAPPTLPAGITGVPPGALERTFQLVQEVKAKPAYSEPMGLDLGIVGSEISPPPGAAMPRIKVEAILGADHQVGRVKFYKDGHQGLWIESRRGTGGWEFLAIDTESPYLDERPLLVAGQPEMREYRARFWDRGEPNGDWCDVASITIAP